MRSSPRAREHLAEHLGLVHRWPARPEIRPLSHFAHTHSLPRLPVTAPMSRERPFVWSGRTVIAVGYQPPSEIVTCHLPTPVRVLRPYPQHLPSRASRVLLPSLSETCAGVSLNPANSDPFAHRNRVHREAHSVAGRCGASCSGFPRSVAKRDSTLGAPSSTSPPWPASRTSRSRASSAPKAGPTRSRRSSRPTVRSAASRRARLWRRGWTEASS